MQRDSCFQLGQLIRKVGNDGRVLLEFDADDPALYLNLESVFVEINKSLIPFFIESLRMINRTEAHLKLEDVDSGEEAEILIGSAVFLPIEVLPELSGTHFYYHEVIGFELRNQEGQSAGVVTDILENGPNDLFRLNLNGREVLIPVADDWIIQVNRIERYILMNWPDGILDLN
jgi:16S rRNA processing protein RimM